MKVLDLLCAIHTIVKYLSTYVSATSSGAPTI